MPVERVSPDQAHQLMTEQGYVYLDVRSIPEFEQGHPEGALNIPLLHLEAGRGMMPNPDFGRVVEAVLPKDTKLVVGCASGNRSRRAAEYMLAEGWTTVVDQRAGFNGVRNRFTGSVTEPGWADAGLPVATGAPTDGSYESLKAQADG